MVDWNRVQGTLQNGFIGLLAGGLISLIGLIPQGVIAPWDKFLIGILLFAGFLIGISAQYIHRVWQDIRRNADLARNYLDFLPRTVRFVEYQREVNITDSGDAVVNDFYRIENISDGPLNTLSIPQYCDVYGDLDTLFVYSEGADPAISLDELDRFIDLREIRINRESIPNPERAYTRRGFLVGDDVLQERGYHNISFSGLDDLELGYGGRSSKVDVEMEYAGRNAVENAVDGEGDYVACDTYHPTDSIDLVVYPPEGFEITLLESEENPEGIDVIDIHGRIRIPHEISEVPNPREVRGERIEWEIEDPKVNYRYRLHFRCRPEPTD